MKPRASSQKRGVFRLARDIGRDVGHDAGRDMGRELRHGAQRASSLGRTPHESTDADRWVAPGGAPPLLIALNKPFGVICQFSRDGERQTLADFIEQPDVYPAGRLDTDSEGLLLLTNHGPLQNWISSPAGQGARRGVGPRTDRRAGKFAGQFAGSSFARSAGKASGTPLHQSDSAQQHALLKTYWVQVEGEPDDSAIARLCAPLNLGDFVTAASTARRIAEPAKLWQRDPPIRYRAAIPTAWLEIIVGEGKNRQVRRMTAAVGHPTLRLVRAAIGPVRVDGLGIGAWRNVPLTEIGYSR